eukprot:jgi/Chlat1/70/Chrsp1S00211
MVSVALRSSGDRRRWRGDSWQCRTEYKGEVWRAQMEVLADVASATPRAEKAAASPSPPAYDDHDAAAQRWDDADTAAAAQEKRPQEAWQRKQLSSRYNDLDL